MILFFDTETTGLPINWKAPVTDLANWPRLVQLAYLVYDFDGNLIHSCNELIKPNGFTIPTDASKIHGITNDIANQRGSNIEDVFELFSIHLKRSQVIVAHNMDYDEKIIGSELIRLGLDNILDLKEKICTMKSSIDLCKIEGPYGYKWPKLEELHRFLFNHDFEGTHDAMADIQATAKCFWELKKQKVVEVYRYIPMISKALSEKINQALMLDDNKEFDVPFFIIDNDGKESWTLFNTKLEIKHHPIEYHEISEVMITRIPSDKNLWNNIFFNVSFWKDTSIDPLFNKDGLWIEKWQNWEIKDSGKLYFKDDFILDIPKLFTIGLIGLNQKMKKVRGFKFYNSEKNISKVIAHYRDSDFSGLFGDGKETVFEEKYFTLFYIDQNGTVFLENNQLEFDSDSCVPFLRIDKEGATSWQFYNYEKDIFFGKLFEDHFEVQKELELQLNERKTYFWWTDYTPKYTGHLIELDEWKGWSTNDEGDLFFNKEFRLNLFDLNLNFTYVDGGPILRFLDSENNISKLIAYCQDGDEYGVNDWYDTQFYIDDLGKIFLENKYISPKEFDMLDAWEAIAEYNAEKDFPDFDIERMH